MSSGGGGARVDGEAAVAGKVGELQRVLKRSAWSKKKLVYPKTR